MLGSDLKVGHASSRVGHFVRGGQLGQAREVVSSVMLARWSSMQGGKVVLFYSHIHNTEPICEHIGVAVPSWFGHTGGVVLSYSHNNIV